MGWAADRPRLTWLIVNWCFRNRKCFTCQFRSQYRRTRREVFPILSRVQNIGYEMGENGRTPEWYRANHQTPWVAGEVPAAAFQWLGSRPNTGPIPHSELRTTTSTL